MSNTITLQKKKETNKGKGSYGYVNKVEDLELGIIYAKKYLNVDKASSKDKKRFKNEYIIMHKYNHENLVRSFSFNEKDYTYIMEYCDSTLQDYIRANNTKLSFKERKDIALQFLNGMKFLHKNGVFHRDLGLTNIMIKKYDTSIKVKVADFGLAKDLSEPLTSSNSDKNRGHYRDPLLDKFEDFNEKNEMYAIGFIIHYIFRGRQNLNLERESNVDLKKIIRKCTNIESINNRYNTVDELIFEIESLNEDNEVVLKNNKATYKLENTGDAKFNILKTLSETDENDIWYNKDLAGERLENNNFKIELNDVTRRTRLKYLNAIKELIEEGLIEISIDTKNNKQYTLTEQGYIYCENKF